MRPGNHSIAQTVLLRRPASAGGFRRLPGLLIWVAAMTVLQAAAAANGPGMSAATGTNAPAGAPTYGTPHFDIQGYVIKYNPVVFSNAPTPALSGYTGTNVGLEQVEQAASAALLVFQEQGYPRANVSVSLEQVTNGIVTLNLFQGAIPQILISGKAYPVSTNLEAVTAQATNGPAGTNAIPHITVVAYEVVGNDLLSDETLQTIFSKYVGTNVTLADIEAAEKELVLEYRARGYDTVGVGLPEQRHVTNGIITMAVFEGTLAEIRVVGNRYYSSNNVMRALPSLTTNMILNSRVFQAELDRANANQDRQVYGQFRDGPVLNTTRLDLVVKDRLPLHGKIELNNQSSPGTPDLRVNSSAVYNNLWQLDHSLGVQYSFSPEAYKQGNQWDRYDQPLVANYSGFYRLPLGNPVSVADAVESRPGSFGFDEATRKFNLPPPSGTPELNFYASRSTIDTGVEAGAVQTVLDIPGVRQVFQQNFQEDLTVNETLGFRLSEPVAEIVGLRSTFSTGVDLKTYVLDSSKTNVFNFSEFTFDQFGNPLPPIISSVDSPVPETHLALQYLPVTLRYDGTWGDRWGPASVGLGLTANAWHSGSLANLRTITGSTQSSGHWVTLNPSLSQDFNIHSNWVLTARADGQWASEPLISTEQFGTGGVASVRGYQEGQVFGDTGWHVSLEQKTPGHVVGLINGKTPLVIRGSIYTDYATSYLLDPQGRAGQTRLWGAGLGTAVSIGSSWDGRFLFSFPLLGNGANETYHPFFNFSLTGQF